MPIQLDIQPECSSTNAELVERIASGETPAEAYWLIADRQTAGHGRHGRKWFDGAGNFMGSTVVHANVGDPYPASLSFVASLAVGQVVQRFLPEHKCLLKWPNDIVLEGAKLSGILLQREGGYVIVGIGVNLVSSPELQERETIALSDLDAAPTRDDFAAALAEEFANQLALWRRQELRFYLQRWMEQAHPIGSALSVHDENSGMLSGTFDGLEDDGALRLRLANGATRVIHAGDVEME